VSTTKSKNGATAHSSTHDGEEQSKSVFVVQHSYEVPETGGDEVKLIGVYSTRENGEAAVGKLVLQPGFRDRPEGFHVEEYRLDKDHWCEGYLSWEALEAE
jgi:hypothetical protein